MKDKINIAMLAFFKAGSGNPRTISFGNLFDVVRANDIEGKPVLPPIQVVAFINIVGSPTEGRLDREPSRIEVGEGRLLLTLRLVKDSVSENRRVGVDLDQTVLDLAQQDFAICGTEFHFINYMHIFDLPSFPLDPGYGKYQFRISAEWLEDGKQPGENSELMSVYEFTVQRK